MVHSDSKILAPEFEFLQPGTPEEAVRMLHELGDKAKVLAGGTDLLVKMKAGLLCPQYLVYVKMPSLVYVRGEASELRIGAATTLSAVLASALVREKYPALHEAVRSMAAVAVRNMGTLGGNLCNASPAADTAPPLIVYGAMAHLLGPHGRRSVPVGEFFLGPGRTVLRPDELLVEVSLPSPPEGAGSSFLKLGRVAADIAKINVAVFLVRTGPTCVRCRIAFGSVAPTPVRARNAEKVLEGKELTAQLVRHAGEVASGEISPITDARSTAEYRRWVSRVMLEEAVRAAWARAGGELV